MKKFICLLLIVMMMFSIIPVHAVTYLAYEAGDEIIVKVNDNTEMTFLVIKNSKATDTKVVAIAKDVVEGKYNFTNAKGKIDSLKTSWTNVEEVKLPSMEDIFGSEEDYLTSSFKFTNPSWALSKYTYWTSTIDEYKTLGNQILADNDEKSGANIDFSKTSDEDGTKGLYYTNTNTEGGKTTYFFRGDVTNNYVKFGKYTADIVRYRGYLTSDKKQYAEYASLEECQNSEEFNISCEAFTYAKKGDDMYYRIVRINEDGSIRLLYQGTSVDAKKELATVGVTQYNDKYDDNTYVGYMYGNPLYIYGDVNFDGKISSADLLKTQKHVNGQGNLIADEFIRADVNLDKKISQEDLDIIQNHILGNEGYEVLPIPSSGDADKIRYDLTHANINDSEVKKLLDAWYRTNLNTYSKYIADSGFCNDRSITTNANSWNNRDTGLGYGNKTTYYGTYNRIEILKQPQFKCPNEANDLFTTTKSDKGNKALTYAVGLLTEDEAVYAGFAARSGNNNTYIGSVEWTISPYYYDYGGTFIFNHLGGGSGYWRTDNTDLTARPVINLSKDVLVTGGDGTSGSPYVIQTAETDSSMVWTLGTDISGKGVAGTLDSSQELYVKPIITVSKESIKGAVVDDKEDEKEEDKDDPELKEPNSNTGDTITYVVMFSVLALGMGLISYKKLKEK